MAWPLPAPLGGHPPPCLSIDKHAYSLLRGTLYDQILSRPRYYVTRNLCNWMSCLAFARPLFLVPSVLPPCTPPCSLSPSSLSPLLLLCRKKAQKYLSPRYWQTHVQNRVAHTTALSLLLSFLLFSPNSVFPSFTLSVSLSYTRTSMLAKGFVICMGRGATHMWRVLWSNGLKSA